jgi:hypothetical protein
MGPLLVFGFVAATFLIIAFVKTEPARTAARMRREEAEQHKLEVLAQADYFIKHSHERAQEAYEQLAKDIRAMPKYSVWREDVLRKHGRRCSICGSTENIEVDHRRSLYSLVRIYGITDLVEAYECEALWEIENGNPLCKMHHDATVTSTYRRNAQA